MRQIRLMRKARTYLLVKTFLGIACFILSACSADDLSEADSTNSELAAIPLERSTGVLLLYSDSAKVKAKLSTPLLLQYHTQSPYNEMPEGLHVDFYDPALKIMNSLSAKYGIDHLDKALVEVRDSVVIKTAKGEVITTQQLFWNQKSKRIYTDKFVAIASEKKLIQGYGLEAPDDLSSFSLKNTTGTIYVEQLEKP